MQEGLYENELRRQNMQALKQLDMPDAIQIASEDFSARLNDLAHSVNQRIKEIQTAPDFKELDSLCELLNLNLPKIPVPNSES